MLPGPISEIVPFSLLARLARSGRLPYACRQFLWIGFVWRRGVLGYALPGCAPSIAWLVLPGSFVCPALCRVSLSSLLAYGDYCSDYQTDWLGRLARFNCYSAHARNTQVIYSRCFGVMCALLNIGCSRRTLKPTRVPTPLSARIEVPRLINGTQVGKRVCLVCLRSVPPIFCIRLPFAARDVQTICGDKEPGPRS